MPKYIPPHLRRLQQQQQASQPPPVPPANSQTQAVRSSSQDTRSSSQGGRSASQDVRASSQDARFASAPDEQDEKVSAEKIKQIEEEEQNRHPDRNAPERIALTTFFEEHSDTFNEWTTVRTEAAQNKHIDNFFEKKHANKSGDKRQGAYVGAGIGKIFSQFYRYAVDIDNGVYYSNRAKDIATKQGSCWFLDFGFAPGGMSDLLIKTHPNISGVGVTLDPAERGNVYLPEMAAGEPPFDRFHCVVGDVIDLAREDADIPKMANLPDTFDGFDFVIVGITIHQEWNDDNMNQLKDYLHFAQLYFAFKYLKPGGMVLMRMHMSIRVIDAHLLALMVSSFNIEKFLGGSPTTATEDAQAAPPPPPKPVSKLSALQQKLDALEMTGGSNMISCDAAAQVTCVATKPFSTFSMRKTYWVLYQGFDCADETRKDIMSRLLKLLTPGLYAYGYDEENAKFNCPELMLGTMDEILANHGMAMIDLLKPVWKRQVLALRGFMAGKTDKFCRRGRQCRRRHSRGPDRCNMAHSDADMIPDVLKALRAVDVRCKDRLRGMV